MIPLAGLSGAFILQSCVSKYTYRGIQEERKKKRKVLFVFSSNKILNWFQYGCGNVVEAFACIFYSKIFLKIRAT
jgi:hypothetical protein